jgi:alkanesulfonate monooxygenase SsuD/methylene tetrahydromethanopterin reductase-like flavin-dependent oxidoreductase (luciferase family)
MSVAKFGVFINTGTVHEAVEQAVSAERDGFFSASVNDHFYSPLGQAETPQVECFTTLTAMAMATSRIKLVPAVAAASFRPPPLLAKIMCSLDAVSNERAICGLGAGWQDKEYINHGYAFPPLKERLEQLDETIQILKAMNSEEAPTYNGKYFQIKDAYNNPRPLRGHIPLMLGGSGTGLLKIAAKEADILNIIPPTGNGKDFINDTVATVKFNMDVLKSRIALLHLMMRDIGRDPKEIELGGLALLGLSKDKNDPSLREIASHLGFPDYAAAQGAPVTLLGTAEEARTELRKRIEETGVTYYIFVMANRESQEIFAKDVMPEFV